MSFQIRHKDLGVYQGSFIGLGFWHPWSDQPEQGFCEFPTLEEAKKYVAFLCSKECDGQMSRDDLTIEPFDVETNQRLMTSAMSKLAPELEKIIHEALKK